MVKKQSVKKQSIKNKSRKQRRNLRKPRRGKGIDDEKEKFIKEQNDKKDENLKPYKIALEEIPEDIRTNILNKFEIFDNTISNILKSKKVDDNEFNKLQNDIKTLKEEQEIYREILKPSFEYYKGIIEKINSTKNKSWNNWLKHLYLGPDIPY